MSVCNYCGKVNADVTVFCTACGTPLGVAEVPPIARAAQPQRAPNRRPKVLNAAAATTILLTYIGVQLLCAIVFVAVATVWAGVHGALNPQQVLLAAQNWLPGVALLGPFLGGVVIIQLSLRRIPNELKDTGPYGAALARGDRLAIAKALLIGLLIAACAHLVSRATKSHIAHRHLGYLNRMAFMPGWPRAAWVAAGVLVAPPIEELLFRGILYGGYRRSFGPTWAAVATTLIFAAFHLPEAIHYLIGFVCIVVVALAALWCRLRSSAIGPSIAVHVGYNAMGTLIFLASTVN